jgi:hypothetical protein
MAGLDERDCDCKWHRYQPTRFCLLRRRSRLRRAFRWKRKMLGIGRSRAARRGQARCRDAFTPVVGVRFLNNAVRIAARAFHTCALIKGGTIQCWGHGGDGELGSGGSNDSNVPSNLSAPSGRSALGVAAGGYESCSIMSSLSSGESGPQVFCWGNNGDGQLGDGTRSGGPFQCMLLACDRAVLGVHRHRESGWNGWTGLKGDRQPRPLAAGELHRATAMPLPAARKRISPEVWVGQGQNRQCSARAEDFCVLRC